MISYKIESRFVDANKTENVFQYVGLSTDDKPTNTNVGNGSSFFEIDTSDVYMFDKSNVEWVKIKQTGGEVSGNYLEVEGGNE